MRGCVLVSIAASALPMSMALPPPMAMTERAPFCRAIWVNFWRLIGGGFALIFDRNKVMCGKGR